MRELSDLPKAIMACGRQSQASDPGSWAPASIFLTRPCVAHSWRGLHCLFLLPIRGSQLGRELQPILEQRGQGPPQNGGDRPSPTALSHPSMRAEWGWGGSAKGRAGKEKQAWHDNEEKSGNSGVRC